MNTRVKFTVLLLLLGLILAFLPAGKNKSFIVKSSDLIEMAADENICFSVDQVARFINNEDTTIQLIDVRSQTEFRYCNLPGSINIPLDDFLNENREGYLSQDKVRNIFYSNDEILSSVAWTIATGLGYKNSFIMKGGMNEWYRTVMNSRFEGERISARENALFENRYNARKIFTEFNSLPDSLKFKLLAAKQAERAKLDGGCE